MYAATLWFGVVIIIIGIPPVHEVLTCLAREIVIRCPNVILEDYARPITQLVEKINKKKSQDILGKVLAARRLPNEDIVVIINMEKTKEQMK